MLGSFAITFVGIVVRVIAGLGLILVLAGLGNRLERDRAIQDEEHRQS